MNDKELVITARSAKSWVVAERPIVDGPIPLAQIKILHRCSSKAQAIAWAEGRQLVTGQRIVVG